MIDALSCLFVTLLFGFFIVLPVYVNMFKDQIYVYVKDKIKEDEKAEKLRRQMLKSKKNKG